MNEKKRILIVDDDEDIRRTLTLIFGRKGYEIETAGTGQEAIAKAKERFFNVAVLDIKLPDMEGVELLAPLQALHPDLVAIMATGYASAETAVQALNQGAVAYVTKPSSMDELLAILEQALERQRLATENKRLLETLQQELADRKQAETRLAQHATQLALINDIGGQIAAVLELDKVLDRAAHLVQKSFDYHHVALFLIEDEALKLKAVAGSYEPYFPPGHTQQLNQGINGWVASHGEKIVANDVAAEPRYTSLIAKHTVTQAELCLPIKMAGQTLGVLDIQGPQRNTFGENDIIAMETLTDQIAVALENARLYETLRQELSERKLVEQALREAEIRYHTLFEQSPDSILIFDPDTAKPLEFNETACRQLGYSRQELSKLSITDYETLQTAEEMQARIERILREGRDDFETKIRTKQGQIRDVLVTVQVVELSNRKVLHTIFHDITKRVQAEEEIRLRNRELALFNRIIAASVAGLKAEAILELACDELGKIFGVPQTTATLLNEEKTEAVVVAKYVTGERAVTPSKTIPVANNPSFQYLLTHKTPLVVSNENDPLPATPLTVEGDEESQPDPISLLMLPLIIEGEVVGSLSLDALESRHFSIEEINLVWSVADQVAGALARARLAQLHQRLITAIEQIAESVIITDTEGAILYVNPAFEQVSGYSRSEAIGQTPRILKSGRQDAAFYALLRATTAAGQVWQGRMVNKKKDGTLYTEEVTISPVRDKNGMIVNYVGVQRDMTQELQLEERFRQVVSSISDHIYVTEVRPEGPHLNRYLSPNFTTLTGYPLEKFTADWSFWPSSVIHPEDRTPAAGQMEKLAGGQNSEIEYRLIRADGEIIWVRDSGRVQAENDPKTIYGVISDITERKQHERELETLTKVATAVRGSLTRAGILPVILDELLDLLQVEGTALDMIDPVSGETVIELGRGAWTNATGLRTPPGKGVSGHVLATGRPYTNDDILTDPHLIQGDLIGGLQAVACVPLMAQAQPIGVLWVGRKNEITPDQVRLLTAIADIVANALYRVILFEELQRSNEALANERASLTRRVEERTAELRAANAELARAARLKDEFLANMSHELRTPLNAILGMSELLRENIYGSLNERQQGALDHIEEGGHHLLTLINDILDLARIEAGKMELEIRSVVVDDICQASLRMIKQMARKKRIKVSTINNVDITLQADERRLKQILVNLLSNAVKFTPERGRIGLEIEKDETEGMVHFTIWDTGIGIAKEDMKTLFKPFVQIDSSFARQHEGTGLGLSLVSRLAEMHQGKMTVESEIGQGSRFTVSLPRQKMETGAEGIWTEDIQPGSLQTPSFAAQPLVLLAEDNEVNITALRDFLQAIDCRVTVARNGVEAIDQAREIQPDLILMDIQMPVMDGFEATRHIRANERPGVAQIPIIALTALAMRGDRERCLAAGMNDYLSKPVSLTRLAKILEEQLGQMKNR